MCAEPGIASSFLEKAKELFKRSGESEKNTLKKKNETYGRGERRGTFV